MLAEVGWVTGLAVVEVGVRKHFNGREPGEGMKGVGRCSIIIF